MTRHLTNIIAYFNKINAIPRCSTHEAQLASWLKAWAAERQMGVREDAAGNLLVSVSASIGYETAPTVVLQGHMDMVCEKTPESSHDFGKDPIIAKTDGDWFMADGTTLGADNGIAIALALALVDDPGLAHPPLELLFTVDEESGLNGAKRLEGGMVSGRILINLDSEEEGVFTVGCAGGQDYALELTPATAPLENDWMAWRLTVGGLQGGHSGIDIHRKRGNANKILAEILGALRQHTAFRLVTLNGGSRHNAIARDAQAVIASDPVAGDALQSAITLMGQQLQRAYRDSEPRLTISAAPNETGHNREALTKDSSDRLVDLLLALPHGVMGVSNAFDGIVETSCNLATVNYVDGKLKLLSSQRSSTTMGLSAINRQVSAVARLVGAGCRSTTAYPPWNPDADSAVLARSQKVYRKLFGGDPIVQVIHAGLECAIIGDICPGMDMISLGPTIENPHSPSERLFLPSVDKVRTFLVALLADIR